ncbi:hypothetical protein PGT21_008695 [Puccinia graminis f. sp. tritici]|uniref:Uncharacterized protein n=1 Tax=Puccinia graminis f. sp. tritici TaxID=56615 RepID=A0A5B0PX41_PUCGR|nr:hypothetical protein PGT21_008695 [Puccinia graminis f. sp. tritici]
MSRYPTPPHSQTDSQSIGLSSYQQRSEHRTQNQQQQQRTGLPLPSQQNLQKSLSSSQQASSPASSPASSEQLDAQIKRTARIHYDLLHSWLHNPADQSNKCSVLPNQIHNHHSLTQHFSSSSE